MNNPQQRCLKGFSHAAVAALIFLGASASGQMPDQRPFQDIYRRPAVSTYNQIANQANNPLLAQSVYQQTVMPQLQQQRQQIQQLRQQRQLGQLQGRVTQIQQGTQARQVDETIRPTGHASTYMNYSHYYQMR